MKRFLSIHNQRRLKYTFNMILNGKIRKVFCISFQRTGTTSVGNFFQDFGFRWSGWPTTEINDWGSAWYEGDFERIFSSLDFKLANAYEDGPWFAPGFYKILFHRFPKSKFILFERNPDDWFASMIKHSGRNVIGRSRNHSKIYRREKEYYNLLAREDFDIIKENDLNTEKIMKLDGFSDHYKDIYLLHSIEVKDFFSRHSPNSLHVGRLEDKNKWTKLGKFLNISVPNSYNSHENKTND